MSEKVNGLTKRKTFEEKMDEYFTKKLNINPTKTPALDYVNNIWFYQVDKENLFNLTDSARKLHEAEKGLLDMKEEATQTGKALTEVKAKSNLLKTVGVRKKTKRATTKTRNDPLVEEPEDGVERYELSPVVATREAEEAHEYQQALDEEERRNQAIAQQERSARRMAEHLEQEAFKRRSVVNYPDNPAGDVGRRNEELPAVGDMDQGGQMELEDRQPAMKRQAEPKAKSKAKAKTGDTAMKKKSDEEHAEAKARAKSKAKTKRGDEIEVAVLPKEEEKASSSNRATRDPERSRSPLRIEGSEETHDEQQTKEKHKFKTIGEMNDKKWNATTLTELIRDEGFTHDQIIDMLYDQADKKNRIPEKYRSKPDDTKTVKIKKRREYEAEVGTKKLFTKQNLKDVIITKRALFFQDSVGRGKGYGKGKRRKT
jgi:hypothetical protein